MHKVQLPELPLSSSPNPYSLKHFKLNLQLVQLLRDITAHSKRDAVITSLMFYNIFFLLFFFWPIKENSFCLTHVNFWKAINCCFSFMNCGIISNLVLYFQWNAYIVVFSHLFLYFVLYKLDPCFTSDIWCRLNVGKIRSFWLIFKNAWFYFGIIAFDKIWSEISFRSHDVKRP